MLLGFKKKFVEPIQIGTKVFTMRNDRKVQPKIGETLYMYCGLRTANCFKITDKEKLISVQRVYIYIDLHHALEENRLVIQIDGRILHQTQLPQFAEFDGFTDIPDFLDYWTHGGKHPNTGGGLNLYHWTDLRY